MRLGCPFYYRLVLTAEADSNSDWTRPLAWLRRPCWPLKVVAKEEDVQGLFWWVISPWGVLPLGPGSQGCLTSP